MNSAPASYKTVTKFEKLFAGIAETVFAAKPNSSGARNGTKDGNNSETNF